MSAVHRRIVEDEVRGGLAAWDQTRHRHPQDIGLPVRDRLARVLSGRALRLAEAEVQEDLAGRTQGGRLVRPDFTGLLELALVEGSDRALDLLAVDEAQDLTPLEWALVDRWRRHAERFLVVGDPDQAIYGWAGAAGEQLVRWLRDGRPARRLSQSWRVPRACHRLARAVIADVQDRVDAPYAPADRDGSIESLVPEEAWLVAAQVQDAGGSVLVLSRTRAGAAAAVQELLDADVPHIAERGRAVLGTADQPSRLLSVCRALDALAGGRAPWATDARRLVQCLAARGGPGFARPGVKTHLGTLLTGRRDRIALDALADAGLAVGALGPAWDRGDAKWWRGAVIPSQVLPEELLIVRDWHLVHGSRLHDVAGRVRVTTCHGSKGREADLVVLDARARWGRRAQSPEDRDEDRRVLYVALTRARERLILVRGARDWLDQHGVMSIGAR